MDRRTRTFDGSCFFVSVISWSALEGRVRADIDPTALSIVNAGDFKAAGGFHERPGHVGPAES
jgi:hypothetical protein